MSTDIVIVRPYVSLPGESAGVDRYWTVNRVLEASGCNSTIITSNFKHNLKSKRQATERLSGRVLIIEAGSYDKNISIRRVLFEAVFSFRAFVEVLRLRPKVVLLGEPLAFAWLFFWLGKSFLFNSYKLVGDFIDLMPEAVFVNRHPTLLKRLVFSPFRFTRYIRISFAYDELYTVSASYSRIFDPYRRKAQSRVFYWGCENPTLSTSPGQTREKNRIVYAGSLGEGYDIELIILLAEARPDLEIVVAGSGPKRALCEAAANAGKIKYVGNLNREDLSNLYKSAIIGLLPYKANSPVAMPVKFFDYISHGLRVVNSLRFECAEIIDMHKIGVNYTAGSARSLGEAIDAALALEENEAVYDSLKRAFSVDRQYRLFADALRSLI